ncbi:MAG: PEGA domain-containing protein [Calditrichaeota bacterium]|nr:PEGA domain-containing protein [Calditrichota bacterium]MCB9368320.1 PEGA domain-containing protein [Calditrichota bacterium]
MPRRNKHPLVQLLGSLAKIGIPLIIIAVAAWWVLNRDATPVGQVRITSTIKGAEIYIDGAQAGAQTDTVLLDIPVGRRLITLRAPGLISDPEVAIVEVQKDRASVATFVLTDSNQAAQPDVIPVRDGVRQDVFATDEAMIRSIPAAPPRKSLLDFSEDDYSSDYGSPSQSSPGTYTPKPQSSGKPEVMTEEQRKSLVGTQISVTSEPPGAAIIVNGARTPSVTPHTFRGLDRGYYVFSLELTGYVATPDSIEVALREDNENELAAFSLQPKERLPVPQLTIQTKPLAAGIKVDGTSVGVGSAKVSADYGARVIEFADVPGYKTPDPVRLSITTENSDHTVVGTYERLSGSALVAVVPNENFPRFDAAKLRVFVDNELILDGPKGTYDATLLGSLYPGDRAIKIQYDDLVAEDIIKLNDGQVAEITIRINAFFSKRSLKFKVKTDIPLETWQARFKKSNILTQG